MSRNVTSASAACPHPFCTQGPSALLLTQFTPNLHHSFYKAKLVPQAKVYVGMDSSKEAAPAADAGLLRSDVAALLGPPPARHDALSKGKQQRQQQQRLAQAATSGSAAAATAAAGAGAAGRAPGGSRVLPTGSKVPKWMKV